MGQFMPTSHHFTSAAGIVEHVTTAIIIWGDATRQEWMFYIISIIVVVGGWGGSVYLLPFWPPMLIFYILCSHDTTYLFYLAITSQYIMVDLRQWMRRVFTGMNWVVDWSLRGTGLYRMQTIASVYDNNLMKVHESLLFMFHVVTSCYACPKNLIDNKLLH